MAKSALCIAGVALLLAVTPDLARAAEVAQDARAAVVARPADQPRTVRESDSPAPPPDCGPINYAFGMNLGYTMYGYQYAAQGEGSPTPDQLAALQRASLQLSALMDSVREWKADAGASLCPILQVPAVNTLQDLSRQTPTTHSALTVALGLLGDVARDVGEALKSPAAAVGGAVAGGVAGFIVHGPLGATMGSEVGSRLPRAAGRTLAPGVRDPGVEIVGTWSWFNGATVTVSAGGALSSNQGFSGTWRCTDPVARTFDFNWTQGPTGPWFDKLTLSADGRSLVGRNQAGNPISGTKIK